MKSDNLAEQRQNKVEAAKGVTKVKVDQQGKIAKVRTQMDK